MMAVVTKMMIVIFLLWAVICASRIALQRP